MPIDLGASGAPYNTQIPSYAENADIQTALRLYHYGEDTDSPTSLVDDSIAGHLQNLENTKIDIVPQIIGTTQDLNSYTTTGYYVQPDKTNAESGSNYPVEDSEFFPGLLKVVNSGALVFQEYHVLGETGNIVNRMFRRVFFNTWSDWAKSIDPTDVTSITDPRYYLKAQVYTQTQANNAFAPKYFTETSLKTGDHTLVLEDLNKVVAMNVPTGGVLTVPTNASVAFPLGSVINVYNANATAFLEITGAEGVTVRNPGTIEPYQEASIRKRATNEWVAAGPVY